MSVLPRHSSLSDDHGGVLGRYLGANRSRHTPPLLRCRGSEFCGETRQVHVRGPGRVCYRRVPRLSCVSYPPSVCESSPCLRPPRPSVCERFTLVSASRTRAASWTGSCNARDAVEKGWTGEGSEGGVVHGRELSEGCGPFEASMSTKACLPWTKSEDVSTWRS